MAGPTQEERDLAEAKVALAAASLATLEAKASKLQLVSPADGTIGIQVAEVGEILERGKPAMTLEVAGDRWFGFTVARDALDGLNVGSPVVLTVADGQTVPARVTELRPLGEYATWRAARAVGDHDLNSFRIRISADAAGRTDRAGHVDLAAETAAP